VAMNMNDSLTRLHEDSTLLTYLENIRRAMQEHFVCLSLDSQGQVIADHIVFIGTLNSVITRPREIFAVAIADHAAEIVVAHNHPSGGLLPSKQDVTMTEQLVAAGQIMGIPLVDHIIVTKDGWFSFKEHSLIT
jgi:DNA repair protein RadC